MPQMGVERRRTRRVPLRLPVRVKGRDADGSVWEEMTNCEDASAGGVSVILKRPVRVGQVLQLALPLPSRFRQYDITEPSYRVYALVRRRTGSPSRLGLLFLGKNPPHGAESLPSGRYFLPGDPRPAAADRHTVELRLRLEAEHAPGGTAQELRAVAENVTPRHAEVKAALPVAKGSMLTVEDIEGTYKTRAEVRSITIDKDGQARFSLFFLDEPLPARLLPSDAAKPVSNS